MSCKWLRCLVSVINVACYTIVHKDTQANQVCCFRLSDVNFTFQSIRLKIYLSSLELVLRAVMAVKRSFVLHCSVLYISGSLNSLKSHN